MTSQPYAAIFLLAGAAKVLPGVSSFPVDISLACFALAVVLALVERRADDLDAAIYWTLLAFSAYVLWAAATSTWSSSGATGQTALLRLVALNLPVLWLGVMAGADRASLDRLFATIAVVALAVAVVAGIVMLGGPAAWFMAADTVADIRGAYQGTTLAVGMGFLVCVGRFLHAEGLARWPWLGGAIVAGVVMLVTGGRSGLIGAVLGAVAIAALSPAQARRRAVIVGAVLIAGGFVVAAAGGELRGIERMMRLIDADGTVRGERYSLWADAWRLWVLHPIAGVGFGGFAPAAGYGDVEGLYPHNVLLQVLAETGIVGAVLFATIWLVILRRFAGAVSGLEQQGAILAGLLVLALVRVQVSGSIEDRVLWFIAGMALCAGVRSTSARTHCGSKQLI
jgi:O-antigen ligase